MILKIFLILQIILLPSLLFANAGTPLVYAHLLYLFPMNLFIAFIELTYLNQKYKVLDKNNKPFIPILLMIGANYLSALIGFLVHYYILENSDLKWDPMGYSGTDENIIKLIFLSGSFFISLIVEFPFIRKILNNEASEIECMKIDLKIHLLSYSILSFQYFVMCNPDIIM